MGWNLEKAFFTAAWMKKEDTARFIMGQPDFPAGHVMWRAQHDFNVWALALFGVSEDVLNKSDERGRTPLMRQIIHGNTAKCKALLQQGAALDWQDNVGSTALIWAVYTQRIEVTAMLLEKGAALDLQDSDGKTALIWGASMGRTEIVAMLLAKGARLDIRDNNGHTALFLAIHNRYAETAAMLRQAGAVETVAA